MPPTVSFLRKRAPGFFGGPDVQRETKARFLREIESELITAGLTQYIE